MQAILSGLRRFKHGVAILVGGLLLACATFVLADIVLRQLGFSLGQTDEISGYVMAIATSWGTAFTLIENDLISHHRPSGSPLPVDPGLHRAFLAWRRVYSSKRCR